MAADVNHTMQDGALRLAGILTLERRGLPEIKSATVYPDGDLAFSLVDRGGVDELAEMLGVTGEPRLDVYTGRRPWAMYGRRGNGYLLSAEEHPPYEPIGTETPANTTPGSEADRG